MTREQGFLLTHAWSILLGYIGVVTTGLAVIHAAVTGTFGVISLTGLLPLPALVLAGYLYGKNTRLKQDLQEKTESLERANRELEEYMYVVSHELKEPLRSLRIFAHFLLEDCGDELGEKGREYAQRLHRAARRLSALVDDLLMLSRIGREDMTWENVDLNELIAEVREELAALIEETSASVKVGTLPTVLCQRRLMGEVFKNIVANGIKFNEGDPPVVGITCTQHDTAYQFSIRDNGIGIEEDQLNVIFDIFTQLHSKEKYGGTGAGLAICKKIVEVHGGHIWTESTPGKGTTLHFTIPKRPRAG